MKNKSCSSCEWFVRTKVNSNIVGFCEYEDCSLTKEVTVCNNRKGKKYVRPKKITQQPLSKIDKSTSDEQ